MKRTTRSVKLIGIGVLLTAAAPMTLESIANLLSSDRLDSVVVATSGIVVILAVAVEALCNE